jgi:hypothetical protein
MRFLTSLFLFLSAIAISAQLTVTVSPPKVIGQKAVVTMAMKNGFSENIKSARAACFLLDEQGAMVGQSAKWVINGNQNNIGLAAGATNEFNFVITSPQPFTTTNLTAKVSFSRVILNGDKQADVQHSVTVTSTPK